MKTLIIILALILPIIFELDLALCNAGIAVALWASEVIKYMRGL